MEKIAALRKRAYDLGLDTTGNREDLLKRMSHHSSSDYVQLFPSSWFIVTQRFCGPNDGNVVIDFKEKLVVGGRQMAKLLAKSWMEEIFEGQNADDHEDMLSAYEDLRVSVDPFAFEVVHLSSGERGKIGGEGEEEIQDEEEEEEEEEEEGCDQDNPTGSLLCFVWVCSQLKPRLVKDVVKMIAGMVKKMKQPLILGVWNGLPQEKDLFLLRITTLVPTYDFMLVDRVCLIHAIHERDAILRAKVEFVKEVDKRWRDGFNEIVSDTYNRDGLAESVPILFNADTVDKFSAHDWSQLWDCCDDNMAPNMARGPAVLRLFSVQSSRLVFELPPHQK